MRRKNKVELNNKNSNYHIKGSTSFSMKYMKSKGEKFALNYSVSLLSFIGYKSHILQHQ